MRTIYLEGGPLDNFRKNVKEGFSRFEFPDEPGVFYVETDRVVGGETVFVPEDESLRRPPPESPFVGPV